MYIIVTNTYIYIDSLFLDIKTNLTQTLIFIDLYFNNYIKVTLLIIKRPIFFFFLGKKIF